MKGGEPLTLLKNYRRRLLTVRLDQSACNEFTELFLLLQREQTICWKCVASLFSFATRVDVDDEVQVAQAAFDEAYSLSIWEDLSRKIKMGGKPWNAVNPSGARNSSAYTNSRSDTCGAPMVTPRAPSPDFFEGFWDWLSTPSSDIPGRSS